jgi:CheY-like chemotaxis protein
VVPLSVILVVDDEPDLRFLLRRIFESAGHEVIEAGNGADALVAVRRSPPDLVVTDVMMPIMDGVELISRLRGDPSMKDIPIVVVSSHGHLAVAADSVVAKPYRSSTLLAAVNALLNRKVDRT